MTDTMMCPARLHRRGGVAYYQHHGAPQVDVVDSDITATINVFDNLISDATYTTFEFNASGAGHSLTGPLTFSNTVEDRNGLGGPDRYVRLWFTQRSTTDSGYVLNEFSVYAV
jgi:hypothetical protein